MTYFTMLPYNCTRIHCCSATMLQGGGGGGGGGSLTTFNCITGTSKARYVGVAAARFFLQHYGCRMLSSPNHFSLWARLTED